MVRWRERGLHLDMSVNLSARNLLELGCDTGQGYLISRPLPAEQLTTLLTNARDGMFKTPGAEPPDGVVAATN